MPSNPDTSLNKLPMWRQIRDSIRNDILAGRHTPGERLPTEQEMAAHFSVNRHTVRRAISNLVEAGFLRVEQGRGMFVQENIFDYPICKRTRFTATVERQGRSHGRRIFSVDNCKADSHVAKSLGMLRGRTVVRLQALQEVDGRPICISENFFEKARFSDIDQYARQTSSITEALNMCGVSDYFRKQTLVTTRMPRRDEAKALLQPQSRPILVTENLDVDAHELPISMGRTLWAGDRVRLSYD